MGYTKNYAVNTRLRVLAACIQWPTSPKQPVYIDTLGGLSVADSSDSNFSANEMVQGALQNCDGQKTKGRFQCDCQLMDLAGSNRLVVPETVTSADHAIRSRPSSVRKTPSS